MVFMGAETIEGNEPLDDAAEADLEEIRSVTTSRRIASNVAGASEHLRASASQREGDAALSLRLRDQAKKTETEKEIPKGEPEQALIDFIEDSIKESGHRRDDYSMLVLWGHAYDFAFGRSRTREGVSRRDRLRRVERACSNACKTGLQERYRQYGDVSEERPTLDIIGFDACDVATVEMACQLQPFAKYLLGSEIGIPIPGWPYDRILDRLRNPKGRLMTPPEFGSYVVRRFCESYPASSPVSLTFLDLAQATRLRLRAGLAGAGAAPSRSATADKRHRIMDLFTQSQTGEDKPFVDVADLCLNLVRYSGDPLVAEAARTWVTSSLSPRPPLVGQSATRRRDGPFIVDHGRNAGELARLNGISLYAPHVALGNDFDAVRRPLRQVCLCAGDGLERLVHTLAKLS